MLYCTTKKNGIPTIKNQLEEINSCEGELDVHQVDQIVKHSELIFTMNGGPKMYTKQI